MNEPRDEIGKSELQKPPETPFDREVERIKARMKEWESVQGGGWLVIQNASEQTWVEYWQGHVRRVINNSLYYDKRTGKYKPETSFCYSESSSLSKNCQSRLVEAGIGVKIVEGLDITDLNEFIRTESAKLKVLTEERLKLPDEDPKQLNNRNFFNFPTSFNCTFKIKEFGEDLGSDESFSEKPVPGVEARLFIDLTEEQIGKLAAIEDGSLRVGMPYDQYDFGDFAIDIVNGSIRRVRVTQDGVTTYYYPEDRYPESKIAHKLREDGKVCAPLNRLTHSEAITTKEMIQKKATELKSRARTKLNAVETTNHGVFKIKASSETIDVADIGKGGTEQPSIDSVLEKYELVDCVEGLEKIDQNHLPILAILIEQFEQSMRGEDGGEGGLASEHQYSFLATYSQEEHEMNRDGNQGLGSSEFKSLIPTETDPNKRILYFSAQWGD